MNESLHLLKVNTEVDIALWKITSEKSVAQKNVLLTHGTFSNRKVLNGISEYLSNYGFTCWIFEWRNHGSSPKTSQLDFNFESIGKEDLAFVFRFLFDQQKIKNLDCITHSGGGICLTISLINYPEFQSKINSITLFACQSFGAASTTSKYLKIWLGKQLSRLLGRVPARKAQREEDESYYFMKQWFDWNLTSEFKGENGVDYKQRMKQVSIPILSVYAQGDQFIAPPKACESFLSCFDSQSNKSLFCSTAKGFSENYNHSRILHSRNAQREIYPIVLKWILRQDIS